MSVATGILHAMARNAALHSPEHISAFLGEGETRLIAAAYRDPARANELFLLADGKDAHRKEFKAYTREHLRCMFADCPEPKLKAVARYPRRRDGFSHAPGAGGHSAESLNHLQGKAVVAQWLAACVPDGTVVVEAATDTQRLQVADVLLTFPDAARVAFEIQYAPLTVAEWKRRHDLYRVQGIHDIWLWGSRTRMRTSRSTYDPAVKLEDVQEEARLCGLPVHWINPETGELGTAITVLRDNRRIEPERAHCDLLIEKFDTCRIMPAGITSAHQTAIAETTKQYVAELVAAHEAANEKARQKKIKEAEQAASRERIRQAERERRQHALENQPDVTDLAVRVGIYRSADPEAKRLCRKCGLEVSKELPWRGYHPTCLPGFVMGPPRKPIGDTKWVLPDGEPLE